MSQNRAFKNSLSEQEVYWQKQLGIEAVGFGVSVISGIGAMTTAQAVTLAEKAAAVGCSGLAIDLIKEMTTISPGMIALILTGDNNG